MQNTDQIKQLFDNAVAATFENKDLEKIINDQIEKTITTAIKSAVDDWDIRKIVEKKIKEAIHIENLDFGNYGKFVENIFVKAVKDFELESLEERLKNVAKGILGAPNKKEYDLWDDILLPLISDETDTEKREIEECGFDGKLTYEMRKYSHTYITDESKWIDIEFIKDKYSSYSTCKLTLYKGEKDKPWTLHSCSIPHSFDLNSTYDTITFKKAFSEVEKRLVDLVMKGCTLTNVEDTLNNYCEEK